MHAKDRALSSAGGSGARSAGARASVRPGGALRPLPQSLAVTAARAAAHGHEGEEECAARSCTAVYFFARAVALYTHFEFLKPCTSLPRMTQPCGKMMEWPCCRCKWRSESFSSLKERYATNRPPTTPTGPPHLLGVSPHHPRCRPFLSPMQRRPSRLEYGLNLRRRFASRGPRDRRDCSMQSAPGREVGR